MMQEQKHDELVPYLGKKVPRRGFRAFIYARDGREKIAESYDEFDLFTHSNDWFATKEEALVPKRTPRKMPSKQKVTTGLIEPKAVGGLIEEDFLPNETGE